MMLVKRNYQPAFHSLVDEFFKNDMNDQLDWHYGNAKPKANITEEEKSFRIDMLVPGFSKSDLTINVEDNLLTIAVEKTESSEEKKDNMIFREFELSNFKRSFQLSNKVDKENIEATFNNGILTINIPKKEEALLRKLIEIK